MAINRVQQRQPERPPERFPNKFLVSARSDQVFILHPKSGQPLAREDALNLCAWLAVIANLEQSEIAEACAEILDGPSSPEPSEGD